MENLREILSAANDRMASQDEELEQEREKTRDLESKIVKAERRLGELEKNNWKESLKNTENQKSVKRNEMNKNELSIELMKTTSKCETLELSLELLR